jgi:hypothetical protein
MVKASISRSRVPWFDSYQSPFIYQYISKISKIVIVKLNLFFFFIWNKSIRNHKSICFTHVYQALQLCFVYEPYEGLKKFQCCFSVSFHPSNTRWRGCQSYQRSQKNQLPYGTLWNHCIYNHALIYAYHLPLPWAYGIGNPYFIALIFAFLVTKRILIFVLVTILFRVNYQFVSFEIRSKMCFYILKYHTFFLF